MFLKNTTHARAQMFLEQILSCNFTFIVGFISGGVVG